jgi:hypothetical protein
MLIRSTAIRLVHIAPSYLLRVCLISMSMPVTAPSDEVKIPIDSKRVDEITKDDARELQSKEVELLMAFAHAVGTDEIARLVL